MDLVLILALSFLATFFLGKFLEKFRIPWIFAALLVGSLLSLTDYSYLANADSFPFLADLGMYFLLFIVGLEIDLKKWTKMGSFIISSTFFIILFETFFGTLLVHFLFGLSFTLSVLVALSFATVGEAILVPILDEFKMLNTKLGQAIIGVGTLDDFFEILTLVLAVFLVGEKNVGMNIYSVILSLFGLFALTYIFTLLKKKGKKFMFTKIETLFFFVITVFLIFIGVGKFADAASLGALLAGIGLKTFIPSRRLKLIESDLRSMAYGFFAPIFFLDVGLHMNFDYLFSHPVSVFLVFLVAFSAKVLASVIAGISTKHFSLKESLALGIGLSVRFSTSLVIISILFKNHLIDQSVFSVIVASSVVFKFIIPPLFAEIIKRSRKSIR